MSIALVLAGAIMVGRAAAIEVVTPTPAPGVCDTVAIPNRPEMIYAGEGNIDRCIEVDAPGECCWTTTVDGYAELTSPGVQCGDHSACFHVYNCDCSGCRFPFAIVIAGERIPGECQNYTPSIPTPTISPDSAPPTTTPTAAQSCETVELSRSGPIVVGEGNQQVCVAVDAPNDCCWETAVSGLATLISPGTQCGDHNACVFVGNCDCSACNIPFEIVIAGQTVRGECHNYTPTARPTVTPYTPSLEEPTVTPTAIGITSPTPSPTQTASTNRCEGDCNADGTVTVDELVMIVDIALGNRLLDPCLSFDDTVLTVVHIVTAVRNALQGCLIPRL